MRFRKQLIAFLSVLALAGATVGATLAAPSSQSTEGDGSEPPSAETEHVTDTKAYLGVAVRPLSERVRVHLELPSDLEGAVVVKAQRSSPAAEAGLRRGDVILSAGDAAVASPMDLREVVLSKTPGDVLAIGYFRDGERVSVDVTLAERPHRNGGGGGGRLQNPLKRFLSVFPKAVDGSFRVLGDDGEVQVYEMARGSITETGEDSLTIEKATGETATFEIGEDTLIVKNGQTAVLSDLEEGTRAVVLSVDGTVKAVVVGSPQRHRPSFENRSRFRSNFGADIERLQEHFRQLRERMNHLHPPVEQSTADPAPAPPADATAA